MSPIRPASWWHGRRVPASNCGRTARPRRSARPVLPKEPTMTKKRCPILLTYLVVLSGGVLGGALVSGRLGGQRREEKGMSDNHFTVDHVRQTTDKPFGVVTTAFERQLGRFEPGVYQSLAAGGDAEGARAKIEAMDGRSGFMLFGANDQGSMMSHDGQRREA